MLRFTLALLISALLTTPAAAVPHPFHLFTGKWAGDGKFWFGKGQKEQIGCRVDFRKNGPQGIVADIRCAISGGAVKVSCSLTAVSHNITGDCWSRSHGIPKSRFAGTLDSDGKSIVGEVRTNLGLAQVILVQNQAGLQEFTLGIGRINLEASLNRKH